MRRFKQRCLSGWVERAPLAAFLLATAALGQGYGGSVPGLGMSTPPKVMIVFDTSNSMRHLPEFDITSGASPPTLPSRGYAYFDDDYSTSVSWDGGCSNRFCIAKSVLHSLLPSYADAVELGLAGFYQYRTKWIPPGGTTNCVYDVLAPSGVTQQFVSYNSTYGGTTAVPPNIAPYCEATQHAYPISLVSTTPGTPLSCTNYKDIGASGNYGNGGGPLETRSGCTQDIVYTRAGPTELYSGGVDQATSRLYLRVNKGATCPAAGQTVEYARVGAADTLYAGTTAVATPGSPILRQQNLTSNAYGAGGAYSWLSNCLNDTTVPAAGRRCTLSFTGTRQLGTETTLRFIWADAGAAFDAGGVVNTYYSTNGTWTMTRNPGADGGCLWTDNVTPTTVGDNQLLLDLTPFAGRPINNCNILPGTEGNGCRVTYTGQATGTQNGTWSVTGPTNRFEWTQPGGVSGTCSVTGVTQTLTWSALANRTASIPMSAFGSSCPASQDITNSATLGSSSWTWTGGAFACSSTTACELRDGASTPIADTATYFSAIPAGSLAGRALVPGYPIDGGIGIHQLTAYGQTCPGGGTAGSTYTFANGASFCSSPAPSTGCLGTFDSYDSTTGLGPADEYWYSNTIAPYTVDGGTYTVGSAVSTVDVPDSMYRPTKPAGGCVATHTVTSGSLPGATGACSSSFPCNLSFKNEECYDVGNLSVQVPCAGGTDSTQVTYCRYQSTKYSYSPTKYGECRYRLQQYKYQYPTCSFTAHGWQVNTTPVCQTTIPGLCRFQVTRYRYQYSDPYSYCQAYGNSYTYSGSTAATYLYSYQTKGGEFVGSIAMPTSQGNLSTRNWCELGPTQYSSIQPSCPSEINASNAASYPSTISSACSGGQVCKLRWRGSATDDAGVTYASGRNSYYNGGLPGYEIYQPTLARCLAPDRSGGETTAPDPETLMSGDITGSITQVTGVNMASNASATVSLPSLPSGTYSVSFRAYQTAAGSDNARMVVALQDSSGTTLVDAGYIDVAATSVSNYSVNVTNVSAGNRQIIYKYINDYCGSPCNSDTDRNLYVDTVRIEKQPTNWCIGNGPNGDEQIRLRSDWYDPSATNSIAVAPYADSWTNQANKTSGWSRTGDAGPADIFVDMGAGGTSLSAVQAALNKCARPSDLSTATGGGLCWADQSNCGPATSESCQALDAGMADYTPLYGSLTNASQYMAGQLAAEAEGDWACREYYVLLVTDGLESTPKAYSQTDLRTAVTQMRTTTSGSRTKDVKTFVVGFGAGLESDAGATDLDIIARAGGTALTLDSSGVLAFDSTNGRALSAQNGTQLRNVLNVIFTNITAGRYSRSRPTLSTDGTQLYQASFERGLVNVADAGSPEWRGQLQAYQLNTSGALTLRWEYRSKLDAQTSRTLKAMIRTDGGASYQDFVASNTALASIIHPTDAGAGAAAIRFARNDTLGAHSDETYEPIAIRRTSRAGAFVFSRPVLVAKPPFGSSYGGYDTETAYASYQQFKSTWTDRPARILIGSNDGIFHGISDLSDAGECADEMDAGCSNGSEAWGIVPDEVLTKLPSTRNGATPMVDGTVGVADVCWPSSGTNAANCTAADWRTMAIGSFRQGGSAFFALDVTDGGFPLPQWVFRDSPSDDDLGYTYSSPMMGRVTVDGEKRWVAFAGGGLRGGSDEGDSMYVLDVKSGTPFHKPGNNSYKAKFTQPHDGESLVASPALYRRAVSVEVESAYFGSDEGRIWGMRIPDNTTNPANDWEPKIFADPWHADTRQDVYGNDRATVWYLNKTTGQRVDTGCKTELGHGGTPNNADLPAEADMTNCSDLGVRRPIFTRPRIANVWDMTLEKPDLYFGTGDSLNLGGNTERNFFFGVHDSLFDSGNKSKTVLENAARFLWVYTFDKGEKILGEAAFVGGSILVSTYVPPAGGSCSSFGDSYIYAFDPRTGEPRNVLLDSTESTPTYRSVVRLSNVGAISDLQAVNGQVVYGRGDGTVEGLGVRAVGLGGRVRGWRRLR